MSILVWVGFGILAGAIAHFIDTQSAKGGLLGSIALGIAGSVAGGFIANNVFNIGTFRFDLSAFVIAMIGALLLLSIQRAALSDPSKRF